MRKYLYIPFLLLHCLIALAQNPHGDGMKMDCASCHSASGWDIPAEYWSDLDKRAPVVSSVTGYVIPVDTSLFVHSKTAFPLTGKHQTVDCRSCHTSLVFDQAQSDCIACHTDIHERTAGNDCARCHTTDHWLVDNVSDIHIENGFPLNGVHSNISCSACHQSETALRFGRNGNDCASCHLSDFSASTNPNHTDAGFSTNCIDCHDLFTPDWQTDVVDHSFFPLTKGHDIADCASCHIGGDFANTPTDCFACHQPDFESTLTPNHITAGFVNDCAICHTTDPDWMPAQFLAHDLQYFPIYSGAHEGEWNACVDCHFNPSNYAEFTCIGCHTNPETDEAHDMVGGYVYEDNACLACHPTGDADNVFDHNLTAFPLTGAHVDADCLACHADGYAGTPTDCASCHTVDYNESINPNHVALGLPQDCAACHTTTPGWAPATFDIHNDFYVLNGAHATIATDCATCHNGDYNNTPNTCASCHNEDYQSAMAPNHATNQFPLDCESCHTEQAWVPSTFDHGAFFPFTGAHVPIADDCLACHTGGNYTNTPNTCAGCHTPDYNQSLNPNHVALGLPQDCEMCHTTSPDWMPASFPIHDDFHPLIGAHAAIADDCVACHNGDYNNTPNTCVGCHTQDFNNTTDPNHVAAQFSTDCTTCHTETSWVPATFDHDLQYFPIYSGAHEGEWTACVDCHFNPSNYAEFTCIGCHTNPETDEAHDMVGLRL
ncbi:MAG: cytochrome c3 family protein [Saprospiraceae bacterium]